MPLTPEEVEAQLEELREGQKKLERRLRSGRAFTENPLALATDLDDLGSVKTFLDFDEVPTPDSPQADQLRLYAKAAKLLVVLNEDGVEAVLSPYIELNEITGPGAPAATKLRLYARSGDEGARLVYCDEAGVVLWPLCSTTELQFVQSYVDVTVANGTSQGLGLVTHSTGFSTIGRVHLTIQNANILATAERPVSCHAYTVTADSFRIVINTHTNVIAARGVRVGWIATGIL